MTEGVFKDTKSDALDCDFAKGTLTNSKFINCGNDGIDVSGTTLKLRSIDIINPSDKAISIGEGSNLEGEEIKISGGEIGIVSKDLSKGSLKNVNITNSRLAFSCFQKKSEYGAGFIYANNVILNNNELNYLIEENSELSIDNVFVETTDINVIEKMYGNEYGKSSK